MSSLFPFLQPVDELGAFQLDGYVILPKERLDEYVAAIRKQAQEEAARQAENQLYTIKEASEKLAISEEAVYVLAQRGDIAACRIGKSVRISPAELSRFIDEHTSRMAKNPHLVEITKRRRS